jgi:hypothetical protein
MFLRKNLENATIHLELVKEASKNLTTQNTNFIPTSNVEKFVFLSKKYPMLKMLKERFGLEVER